MKAKAAPAHGAYAFHGCTLRGKPKQFWLMEFDPPMSARCAAESNTKPKQFWSWCRAPPRHDLTAVPGTAVAVQAVFSDCSEACKTSKAVLAPSIKPVAKHVKPVKPEDSKNSYN